MKRLPLLTLMFCLPLTAHGELVTIGFEGQLNNFFQQNMDLGVEFEDGETFTGQFTYDSLGPLDPTPFPAANVGEFSNALIALQIDVSGYTIVWDGTSSQVRAIRDSSINGVPGDHFSVSRLIGLVGDDIDGVPLTGGSVVLTDSDRELYANNAKTQSLTPVFDFGTIDSASQLRLTYQFFAEDPDTGDAILQVGVANGPITRVFVVPEPTSIAWFAIGGLLVTRRRQARSTLV
ncbi:MAG: PEP-CTERM sorting domain-containing protein [Planctomycetota bacterium]